MPTLRAPAIALLATSAWLWLPSAARAPGAVVDRRAVDDAASLVPATAERDAPVIERVELVAAAGQPGRRWVRAVRDLLEDRLDVDALAPETPVTVWIAGDELVAFRLLRPPAGSEPWDDAGGEMFAARVVRGGAARWYFDDGTSLDGPVLSRPVRYQAVSSKLGVRDHPIRRRLKWHAGTDYAAPIGTPVRAVADGRVVKAARNWVAGNYVVIRHDDGTESKYLHLHERAAPVVEGARIRQGEVIGLVGKSGRVTGPHLHFELRDAEGRPLDPTRAWWPAATVAGHDVRRLLQAQERLLDTFLTGASRDWGALVARTGNGVGQEPASPASSSSPLPPALAQRTGSRASRLVPPPRRRRPAIARLVFDEAARARRDPLLRRAIELAAAFLDGPIVGAPAVAAEASVVPEVDHGSTAQPSAHATAHEAPQATVQLA